MKRQYEEKDEGKTTQGKSKSNNFYVISDHSDEECKDSN